MRGITQARQQSNILRFGLVLLRGVKVLIKSSKLKEQYLLPRPRLESIGKVK